MTSDAPDPAPARPVGRPPRPGLPAGSGLTSSRARRSGRTGGDTVTGRVFSILEVFDHDHPALTLTEIARAASLPVSTAHRLVGELAGWGALERGGDGAYRIGLRLWEVGSLAPRSVGLRERAMPFLEDLYEATRQNVQLAVRDGHEGVYVERLAHPEAVRLFSRIGGRWPLHGTAVGQILLAFAPPVVQESVLAAPLVSFTARTITDAAILRRTLAGIRRDGVAVCDGMIDLAALSVAAPVRGESDTVVASISVVVPSPSTSGGIEPRTLVPAVRAAARGISRALGAPTPSRTQRPVRPEAPRSSS